MGAFWKFFFESAMDGSELEQVFETVYGKNTVTHKFFENIEPSVTFEENARSILRQMAP